MPFSISGNLDAARADLEELHRINVQALKEIESGNNTAAGRMVKSVTLAFAEAWERDAPRDTGALAGATRGDIDRGQGLVFIDPAATNPASRSKPAVYGPIVHRRQPWVSNLLARGGLSGVVTRAAKVFVEDFGGLYA